MFDGLIQAYFSRFRISKICTNRANNRVLREKNSANPSFPIKAQIIAFITDEADLLPQERQFFILEDTSCRAMKNLARKCWIFLCTINFEVTWPFWKMWNENALYLISSTTTISCVTFFNSATISALFWLTIIGGLSITNLISCSGW